MSLKIPYNLSVKAAAFPEISHGVTRATLVLLDGRRINGVCLARGGAILKIRNKPINGIKDIDFNIFEIKDVVSEV